MYIQITTRCNMRCAHCCMSATKKGQDMSWETFQRACQQAEDYGDHICLGGGEPTLHPEFERFLFHAIACSNVGVWLATNGSQTNRALTLAKLAKKGVIGAALSLDEWHDPIDPRVVEAFKRGHGHIEYDRREIRDVSKSVIAKAGRAASRSFARNYNVRLENRCGCDGEAFVTPDGNVHQCGCVDSPIVGNVRDGYEPLGDEYDDPWECYKSLEKKAKANTELELATTE